MNQIINAQFSADTDLDTLLEELGEEFKIVIQRKEPEWCCGHIRTVYFDPQEPIGLDWITKQFGGSKLQIKVYGPNDSGKKGYITGKTIDILGPPRDGHGVELVRGPEGNAVKIHDLPAAIEQHRAKTGLSHREERKPIEVPAPQPVQPAQDNSMFQAMLNAQAEQNKIMMQMMLGRVQTLEQLLYQRENQTAVPQPPANYDPFGSIKQAGNAIKQLESIKESLSGGGGTEDDGFMNLIGTLGKAFISNQQQHAQSQPSQPARAPVVVPPRQQPAFHGPPPSQPSQPAQPAQPSQSSQVTDESLSNMANKLASLGTDDVTEVALQAFADMPADKRAQVAMAIVGELQNDSGVDDTSIDDDTYYQDEGAFDEVPDSDREVPSIGRDLRPDAANVASDRKSNP